MHRRVFLSSCVFEDERTKNKPDSLQLARERQHNRFLYRHPLGFQLLEDKSPAKNAWLTYLHAQDKK